MKIKVTHIHKDSPDYDATAEVLGKVVEVISIRATSLFNTLEGRAWFDVRGSVDGVPRFIQGIRFDNILEGGK